MNLSQTSTAPLHRLWAASALALIAVVMSACGGTVTPKATRAGAVGDAAPTARPASTGAGDACSLITEQEVTTVLGEDPGNGTQSVPGPKGNVCTYGDSLGSNPVLHIVLRATGGKSALANDKVVDRQGVDVAGVGDAAYGVFDGGNATVSFYKGESYASIGLGSSQIGASPQKDHAIALAKTAAGRM
jgi:hypothetical protein